MCGIIERVQSDLVSSCVLPIILHLSFYNMEKMPVWMDGIFFVVAVTLLTTGKKINNTFICMPGSLACFYNGSCTVHEPQKLFNVLVSFWVLAAQFVRCNDVT